MSAAAIPRTPVLRAGRAVALKAVGMTKRFGAFTALDHVTLDIPAGQFHVLLGENGAGKSTVVKCIMGFYQPDEGSLTLDGQSVTVRNPRDARALGIGMVYQQFTLVPSLTGAENLVISRADAPGIINWRREKARLADFMAAMPFTVPLERAVATLSAGEKQKLEILKLLYLDQRFLILDEPTSVLTPGEADEILGLLRGMTERGELSVLMISHKFREVMAFGDAVSVLRRGAYVGGGLVKDLTPDAMARMMIGDTAIRERATRMTSLGRPTVARTRRPVRRRRSGRSSGRWRQPQDRGRRDPRHRGRVGQRAGGAGRGAGRPASVARRPHLHSRQAVRARASRLRPFQGLRPSRGAAQERHRAAHVGRREHGVPRLRQASHRQARLVAQPRAHRELGPRR